MLLLNSKNCCRERRCGGKSEAASLHKRYVAAHKRVATAVNAHNDAVSLYQKKDKKLQQCTLSSQELQQMRMQPPLVPSDEEGLPTSSVKKSGKKDARSKIKRLFKGQSKDDVLERRQMQHMQSKLALQRSEKGLSDAVGERDSGIAVLLEQLQRLEETRVQTLQWGIPLLTEHQKLQSAKVIALCDEVLHKVTEVNFDHDLEHFISIHTREQCPPAFVVLDAERSQQQQQQQQQPVRSASGTNSGVESSEARRSSSRCGTFEEASSDTNSLSRQTSEQLAMRHSVFGGSLSAAIERAGGRPPKLLSNCFAFLKRKSKSLALSVDRCMYCASMPLLNQCHQLRPASMYSKEARPTKRSRSCDGNSSKVGKLATLLPRYSSSLSQLLLLPLLPQTRSCSSCARVRPPC